MRGIALALVVFVGFQAAGCRISRHIVDLAPSSELPRLEDLERHLDYVDPDAGQPDYVRTD